MRRVTSERRDKDNKKVTEYNGLVSFASFHRIHHRFEHLHVRVVVGIIRLLVIK